MKQEATRKSLLLLRDRSDHMRIGDQIETAVLNVRHESQKIEVIVSLDDLVRFTSQYPWDFKIISHVWLRKTEGEVLVPIRVRIIGQLPELLSRKQMERIERLVKFGAKKIEEDYKRRKRNSLNLWKDRFLRWNQERR